MVKHHYVSRTDNDGNCWVFDFVLGKNNLYRIKLKALNSNQFHSRRLRRYKSLSCCVAWLEDTFLPLEESKKVELLNNFVHTELNDEGAEVWKLYPKHYVIPSILYTRLEAKVKDQWYFVATSPHREIIEQIQRRLTHETRIFTSAKRSTKMSVNDWDGIKNDVETSAIKVEGAIRATAKRMRNKQKISMKPNLKR